MKLEQIARALGCKQIPEWNGLYWLFPNGTKIHQDQCQWLTDLAACARDVWPVLFKNRCYIIDSESGAAVEQNVIVDRGWETHTLAEGEVCHASCAALLEVTK